MEFKGGMVRHDAGEAGRDGFTLVLCVIFRHLKIELLWRSSLQENATVRLSSAFRGITVGVCGHATAVN